MKKNCRVVHDALPDAAAGLADDAVRLQVEKHLAVCATCRDDFALMRTALDGLAQEKTVPDPGHAYWTTLLPRIHERIEQQQGAHERVPALIPRLVLPLGVLLIVLVTTFTVDIIPEAGPSTTALSDYLLTIPETDPSGFAEATPTDDVIDAAESDIVKIVQSGVIDDTNDYQALIETLPDKECNDVLDQLAARTVM